VIAHRSAEPAEHEGDTGTVETTLPPSRAAYDPNRPQALSLGLSRYIDPGACASVRRHASCMEPTDGEDERRDRWASDQYPRHQRWV